ncbi:MAG: MBL fold metallo-hydrolase [Acidobacteria bacterium]|nr:MAG: MBL fold metallo-hydrolase [Acidobacteriota bacterium]
MTKTPTSPRLNAWKLLVLIVLVNAALTQAQDFKVTLLGTASPAPRPDRFGPSTLVEVGPEKFLFDVGRGVPIRLWQLRIPLGKITGVFLTHLHSDHTSGIPDLWLTGWLQTPYGSRTTPFRIWGPVGTTDMMAHLEKAYQADIRIRLVDEKNPPEGIAIVAEEFQEGVAPEQGSVVYDKNGVKVTAFTVDHGAAIKPAVGFRIDYQDRSVVISGDTRYDENLIKHAKGTQLLIYEVAAARPKLIETSPAVKRIIGHHTSPQEAGHVFSVVAPKLAAYTHIVLLSNADHPEPTLDDLVNYTRETYEGPLQLGEDLMSFVIEQDGSVTVQKFDKQ